MQRDIPAHISAVPSKCHMPLPLGRMEGKVHTHLAER